MTLVTHIRTIGRRVPSAAAAVATALAGASLVRTTLATRIAAHNERPSWCRRAKGRSFTRKAGVP
jgi:hypothetical protein